MAIRTYNFCEKGITLEQIDSLAAEEGKKSTRLKLELSQIRNQPGENDDDEDNDYNNYICS